MKALDSRILGAVAALAVLLLAIAWIAGFLTTKIDPALVPAASDQVDQDSLVAVESVVPEVADAIPASVVARNNTVVASRILSTVSRVTVRPGDVVGAGDVLVALDQADLNSRVQQAREQVNAVNAQLDDARRRLARVTELRAQGMAAQADLDQARATVDSLTAQQAQASQALSEAEIVVGYATIRAPIAGRVVERMIEPGDTVSPGTPVITLYDPASLQAQASVPESRSVALDVGQQIRITVPSLSMESQGVIEEIVPAADAASRTFIVKVAIDYNPAIRPGMFARFHVPQSSGAILLIPARCLSRIGQLDMVEVYSDGQLSRRFVRPGREGLQPDSIEIISGISAGETLYCP